MTTLDKLRAIHREVCHCWRLQSPRPISEGEAEILNLGFIVLEELVELHYMAEQGRGQLIRTAHGTQIRYLDRVHSQFDSDADVVIKGE